MAKGVTNRSSAAIAGVLVFTATSAQQSVAQPLEVFPDPPAEVIPPPPPSETPPVETPSPVTPPPDAPPTTPSIVVPPEQPVEAPPTVREEGNRGGSATELRRAAEEAAGAGGSSGPGRTRVRVPRRDRDLTSQIRQAGESEDVHSTPGDRPVTPATNACLYYRTGGWLQPSQGVWQDDAMFRWVTHDSGGNSSLNSQLEITDERGIYKAWLPMVAGRDTVLVGIDDHRRGGNPRVAAPSRYYIGVRGKGNCTKPVPVKMQFKLDDAAGSRILWVSKTLGSVPLEGPPAQEESDFEMRLLNLEGIPPPDVGAFTIAGRGGSPYTVTAELIRADSGAPTGLMVSVGGTVEVMQPPVVKVVPIVLNNSPVSAAEAAGLDVIGLRLARAIELFVPDYFPLAPGSMGAFAGRTWTLADLDPLTGISPDSLVTSTASEPDTQRILRQAIFESRISDRLGTAAMLGGADRMVAVVRGGASTGGSDIARLADDAAGLIGSTKVLYAAIYPAPPLKRGDPPRTEPAHQLESITTREGGPPTAGRIVHTISHELAHSLPDKLWSGPADARHNMRKSCGSDYHNTERPVSYGIRLTNGGTPFRKMQIGVTSIMGPGNKGPRWVDQCTYAHLLSAMRTKPDPELFLVRAFLSQIEGQPAATLAPGYDMLGVSDVSPQSTGSWSLRARDRRGRVIATYPFEPVWQSEENVPRQVISVAYRIPAAPEVARIEVLSGARVLAAREMPARRPTLTVKPPALGGQGLARLEWSGRAEGRGKLLATVLYSYDGGKTFDEQIFEQPVQQAEVKLDPIATEHVVKVMVTDGARSAEQIVRFPGTGDGKRPSVVPENGADW